MGLLGPVEHEWTLAANEHLATADIAAANDPLLRHFTVTRVMANSPSDDVTGTWFHAEPKSIAECSAVAYYMARDLRKALNVPVGVIVTSWGGTQAEAWVPMAMLQSSPELRPSFNALPIRRWGRSNRMKTREMKG